MTSIFRLEEIRIFDSEEHWYRDAGIMILGHYSSLEIIIVAMLMEQLTKSIETVAKSDTVFGDNRDLLRAIQRDAEAILFCATDLLSAMRCNASGVAFMMLSSHIISVPFIILFFHFIQHIPLLLSFILLYSSCRKDTANFRMILNIS
jgi:hypothetical protein